MAESMFAHPATLAQAQSATGRDTEIVTVVVGAFADHDRLAGGAGAAAVEEAFGIDIVAIAKAQPGFDGGRRQSATVVARAAGQLVRLVVVGLGERENLETQTLFDAAVWAGLSGETISALALEGDGDAHSLVAEGHLIGGWRYVPAASGSARPADRGSPHLTVLTESSDDPDTSRVTLIAEATNWVRHLAETPPNLLGPAEFAAAIAAFAEKHARGELEVTVWDEDLLRARGFGGTLGVAAGSERPARLVELRLRRGDRVTGLAGKGITFDSGGTNLKRDLGELAWMKSDMAAAASVAAATVAAAALGTSRSLHAILPIAENMPGGGAQRPGDVVTHPDGRTTEVTDTDCEGRLVLADAIAWLVAQKVDDVIDVGTLTDSGGVGHAFWGCWTSAPRLAEAMVAAGRAAADPGWALPLHESYGELLASRVADIANAPSDVPDSGQLAATYLRSFAGSVPWLHLDNGSSAWLERDAWPWRAGATATPFRALVGFLTTPNR